MKVMWVQGGGRGWKEALGRAAWDGVAMGTAACQEPCLQSRGAVRVWQVPEGGGWCMVCMWVAVLMEAPWDSSFCIPDQNPNLRGKWYHLIFPGRCPAALSPLLQVWRWNHSGHCEGGSD